MTFDDTFFSSILKQAQEDSTPQSEAEQESIADEIYEANEWLTVAEAVALGVVSEGSLRTIIRRGKVETRLMYRQRFVDKRSLIEYALSTYPDGQKRRGRPRKAKEKQPKDT